MTEPNDPRREPSDEDAARLLEAGLGPASGSREAPPPPEAVAAHFPGLEILEVLGQGGMGVVYKARQRALDRIVALKVLPESLSQDPAFAERFTREARMLAKLQHPQIVLVYEFGESNGRHYLLMEYVDGVTLRQLMDTQSLTAKEALAIVPQVCDALQYAHDQGVVHRDIKPENVLLDRTGKVKVADFGLGKLMDRGAADFTLTGTGQVMGTLQYMAPEQYKSPQDVDHRADIFSLGVVFYEMLTGELPVGRFANPSETTSVDARIDEIVLKALERERDLRYQHASDVKAEVSTIGLAPPPTPHGFGQRHATRQEARTERHGGRRFSKWASIAALSIPIGALLGLIVYGVVEQMAGGHGGWKKFYATVAGYWTAMGGFGLSAVLSIVALIVTSIYTDRVRGRWLAVGSLIVSLVLVPVTLFTFAQELENVRRYRDLYGEFATAHIDPPPSRPQPVMLIRVKGAKSALAARTIRDSVYSAWVQYVETMRDHDLDLADARRLYPNSAWKELRAMDPDELRKGSAAGMLGMPLVGRKLLPMPPWELEIKTIEVGPWERQAVVTVRSKRVRPTVGIGASRPEADVEPDLVLTIPMQKEEGRWVFAVVPVKFDGPVMDGR